MGEIAAWFWHHHGRHDRDRASTWYRLERLVDGLGAATRADQISDAALARWVVRRRARPTRRGTLPAPATVNREIELLRRVLRRAARPLGLALPAIAWGELRRPEPAERVVEMTGAEEGAFFAALDPGHAGIFRHYLLTGVRLSMAVELRRRDLDLDGGWVSFTGKARPGAAEPSRHALPVTPALRAIYLAALEGNTTEHVFAWAARRTSAAQAHAPARIRGRLYPYTASGVASIWRRARARAALTVPSIARLRLHDLRHTAATRFYRETKDLRLTQRLLGHADARTTQKYAHVFDRDLAAALTRHHAEAAPALTAISPPRFSPLSPPGTSSSPSSAAPRR